MGNTIKWACEWERLFKEIPNIEERGLFLTRGVGDRLIGETCITVRLIGQPTDKMQVIFEDVFPDEPESEYWESEIKRGAKQWLCSIPRKFNKWQEERGNGPRAWNNYYRHHLCILLDGDHTPETEEVQKTIQGLQEVIWESGNTDYWELRFYKLNSQGDWEEIHAQPLKGRVFM